MTTNDPTLHDLMRRLDALEVEHRQLRAEIAAFQAAGATTPPEPGGSTMDERSTPFPTGPLRT